MDQNALAIRQAQWEQIVAECNAAGISKKEWCAKNGIPEKSFYYWQRRIRQQIAAKNSCKSADDISSSFVELPISPSPASESKLPVPDLSPELLLQIGDCQLFIDGRVQEQT
jgi:putative transposase